jgi:hypothetical protein
MGSLANMNSGFSAQGFWPENLIYSDVLFNDLLFSDVLWVIKSQAWSRDQARLDSFSPSNPSGRMISTTMMITKASVSLNAGET